MSKRIYLTTTLPYVNAKPHLGFALEIIQADVVARYYRQKGWQVFFNTGTDEHGLKIYQKAIENKISPQKYVDQYAKEFQKLKEALNLSYDNFIRTTDNNHIEAAKEFWLRCLKNGDIYKKKYKIKYCVGCEMEKTDSELVNGRCPLHPDRELEIIEEENYFFRYSKYQEKLLNLYKKNPNFVVPKSRLNEIISFTKNGLKDFSISRLKEKLPWGIPVPGDESQVMYVWFDALVNYISAIGWLNDKKKFNHFWPAIQFAGKDNLRQQSSMWQAMLMSAGLLPSKQIVIHGFITSEGRKMSKTLGNVVNPFDLVKKYGTDAVRYYLLREFSPFEDGDFTIAKFEKRYTSDLAKGLGNLVSRIMKLRQINGGIKIKPSTGKFKKDVKKARKEVDRFLGEYKYNDALDSIWRLISLADHYLEEKKPWRKENREKENKKTISELLYILEEIAEMICPFLPQTSEKIKNYLSGKEEAGVLFPQL